MPDGARLERPLNNSVPASRTQGGRLAGDVTAGLVVAAVMVTISVSVGTLLTAVAGPEFAARGIGLAITSSFIAVVFVIVRRAAASSIPTTQDAPAAVLAGTAVGLVADIGSGGQVAFATIMALSALTTVVTGVTFMTVGWLRLGRLVRFLPYPVMGGFLAGTGWLLLLGGLTVMAGGHVDLAHLGDVVEASWLYTVVPGLAFALVLMAAGRRLKHPAANPLLTIGGFLAFYVVLLVSGSDLEAWRAEGLLIGGATGGTLLFGYRLSDLATVDWNALATQLPLAATVPVVALVATLLNITAAELEERGRIDLDRELRAAGLGNLVAGALGGMVPSLESGGIRHLVLDLSRVSGLDASGTSSLNNLAKRAGDAGTKIALAGVPDSLEKRLRKGGVISETSGVVELYPTVDAALEAQESRLLTEAGLTLQPGRRTSLADMLAASSVDVAKLEGYLERIELDQGAVLIEQGTDADALYLVSSGRVTAERARPGLPPERFETMGAGSVVGELGLATGKPRAATVRADTATVAHKLSRTALRRLEDEDPATAAALYGWLTRNMSGRIAHLMTTVDALRR